LVYRQGFLIATATVLNEQARISTGIAPDWNDHPGLPLDFIHQLNRRLTLIQLMEKDINGLFIANELQRYLRVGPNGDLVPVSTPTTAEKSSPPWWTDMSKLALNHPRRLNLLHTHQQQFLHQIKKNAGAFVTLFSILFLCILVFLFSIGYRSYHHQQTLNELTRVFDEGVSRYLPQGTPAGNALQILQEQVDQLQTDHAKEQRYSRRHYSVSNTLTRISELKNGLPSLQLDRFSYNETSVRFGGTVQSIAEFEQLIAELRQIYQPETHDITYNQQHRGGDKIEFSVSIQRLGGP
jgi:hypothetical protein